MLVGIIGFNRVGKSTFAEALVNRHPLMKRRNFGDYLKAELATIGFPEEFLRKKTDKARALMRAYGDAKREVFPLYFAKEWEKDTLHDLKNWWSVVVDDIYHLEELTTVLMLGRKMQVPVVLINVQSPKRPKEEEMKYDSVRESALMREFYINSTQHLPLGPSSKRVNTAKVLSTLPLEAVEEFCRAQHAIVYNGYSSLNDYKASLKYIVDGVRKVVEDFHGEY